MADKATPGFAKECGSHWKDDGWRSWLCRRVCKCV